MVADDLSQAKQQLRSQVLAQRRRRSASLRTQDAYGLREALTGVVEDLPPGDVAAFVPLATEPPLLLALESLHNCGRKIWVPVVEAHHAMRWCLWTPTTPLVPGPMSGLREPAGARHGIEIFEHVRLLVVPAVAVGEDGARLGFGGGYYDRFLEQLKQTYGLPKCLVCVFSHEVLPPARLPREPHDCVIHHALTERGILALGSSYSETVSTPE